MAEPKSDLPTEPDNDLSAFEDALSDTDLDSLNPDDESEESKSELGIIRDTLNELAKEYGFEYQIYDGRELGYELALYHRLDDMSYSAPGSLSDELALSIQRNQVSEEQASDIYIWLYQGVMMN
jgi:hypothetical protein